MARFLHRVRLENYKSIAHCDVELKDLTFLVGPNGAGKSNFLQALNVNFTFYQLVKTASISINSDDTGDLFIRSNETVAQCQLEGNFGTIKSSHERGKKFNISGKIINELENKILFIFIRLITRNYIDPNDTSKDAGIFQSDGANLWNILSNIQNNHKKSFSLINGYIRQIVPEIERIWILYAGGYNILQFTCTGSDTPFNASQMSDGTLHALGVLTAIFHAKSAGIPLIGIEEPEAGLHPAAARVLREALIEASEDVQIIVTSHSPDLLDSPDIDPDSILAVVRENGETKIGPIDAASRKSLSEHLFTAGELLRMNQLEPAA